LSKKKGGVRGSCGEEFREIGSGEPGEGEHQKKWGEVVLRRTAGGPWGKFGGLGKGTSTEQEKLLWVPKPRQGKSGEEREKSFVKPEQ